MEVPKLKENVPICATTVTKVRDLLITLLQVKKILANVSTHLLFCIYLLISNRRKKLNRDTKYIMPEDQTYCFNYLIARKL